MSSSIPDYAFKRAFQTDDLIKDPALLTRYAQSDTPLRSFEGQVGNAYPGDVIVTSPNSQVLYAPPLNNCRVRLRDDLHYGQDDPLFHPQPFHRPIAHLAVLPLPSSDPGHPLYTAWVRPTAQQFEERTAVDICPGMGRLSRSLYWAFHSLASDVLVKASRNSDDVYVKSLSMELSALLGRLESQWATKDVTFLRFAHAQRQYLELTARFSWVERFRNAYMGMAIEKDGAQATGKAENVMGAFSDELDVVERLFRAGIPVWYVRPISQALDVRIDRVQEFIVERSSKISLHCNYEVNLKEPRTPHRVIYSGLANKPERYQSMANFIHSLLHYPSLFGSYEPRSSTSLIRNSAASSSVVPGHSGPNPYSRTGKAPASDKHGLNTFVDPISPLMPPGIPAWDSALQSLSNHNNALAPTAGTDRGFFLPPPRLFVTPVSDETKVKLVCNWLKMRHVLLYGLVIGSRRLSNKEWRSLLLLGTEGEAPSHPKRVSRANEMRGLLKDFIEKSQLSLNPDNLEKVEPSWNGHKVAGSTVPSPSIMHEILWELFELNFRQELLALDRELDTSGMNPYDRQQLLNKCWVGSADVVPSTGDSRGLGNDTIEVRAPFIRALHKVMSTWRIGKPLELMDPFPGDELAHNFLVTVGRVERALASAYTGAALEIFGRAALVPHRFR
ncbi:hypothetical protein V5O48_016111 [Marasmius crinis-equi]|uniref:Uncharacterized protein n=1 Tax=Marasmius crinis-equi TaxID=585013 RepID=A0ABR3ESM1_9AGAR